MTKYLKSRTILVAVLIAVFGALEMVLPMLNVYLEPWQSGAVTIVTAGVMAYLRAVTTLPLGARVEGGDGDV